MQPLWCSSEAKQVSLSCVILWFKGTIKPLHGSGAFCLGGLGFTTQRVAPRVDHPAGSPAGGKRVSPAP